MLCTDRVCIDLTRIAECTDYAIITMSSHAGLSGSDQQEPAVLSLSVAYHKGSLCHLQVVLSESGKCPFTQRPLKAEQCHILTKNNIQRFASRIIADKETLGKYGLDRTVDEMECS